MVPAEIARLREEFGDFVHCVNFFGGKEFDIEAKFVVLNQELGMQSRLNLVADGGRGPAFAQGFGGRGWGGN